MEDKPKKPISVDVIANIPRKDNYSGSGNPHLQPDELQNSKAWKEHKPAKQLPKKKA